MRKTYVLWFAFLAILLLGCRNEDLSNGIADSQREEEFFREALSKTARIKNGSSIVAALKKQNEKSHFVSKMKDQSGLPIWDKIITFKKPKTANKGEGGDGIEEYVIPLTENDKDLSSILYVTKYPDDSFTFNNIDNERLKQEVFNPQIDKDYREQLLLNFILTDNLSFSKDAVYWNIPDDLLASIPQSTIYPQRRFTATVDTTENGGSTNNLNDVVICVTYEVPCSVCDENSGHHTYVTSCFAASSGGYGGGLGDGGGGDTGGNTGGNNGGGDSGGGGGSPTGNPGNNDDCGGANKAFYKVVPGCDDDGGGESGYMSPCERISAKQGNAKYSEKFNNLNQSSIFSMDRERAFFERQTPPANNLGSTFIQLDGSEGTTGLGLPSSQGGIVGLLHSHNDKEGSIKIFSPTDIRTFINTFLTQANNYLGSYTNAYSTVVTSTGSYTLLFTESVHPGGVNFDKLEIWKAWYKKQYRNLIDDDKLTQANTEKIFTQFLKEVVNINGLEVYRVTGNSATKLEYNGKGNPVKETPCP